MQEDKINRIKKARAEYYKHRIKTFVSNLENDYNKGLISYNDYFFKLSKFLKGKTEREWYEYYDNYAKSEKLKLTKPYEFKSYSNVALVTLFLIILGFGVFMADYTGFAIFGGQNMIELSSDSVNANEIISLTLNPTSSGLHNQLSILQNSNIEAIILLSCNDICYEQQIVNYRIPQDWQGNYTVLVYDFESLEYVTKDLFVTVKAKALTPTLKAKKKHFSIIENSEFDFEYISQSEFEASAGFELAKVKKKKAVKKLVTVEETIDTEIYDYAGRLIDLNASIEEIRKGKFDLKINSSRGIKAGIYKLKVNFTKDNQNYQLEEEFALGLVSVNTKKSIYKPSETAELIIVVLDKDGRGLGNADINMTITDPNGLIKDYSSNDGITAGSEVGLYDASYLTSVEGTHLINIVVNIDNKPISFSTNFLVQQDYEFDIIRDAESKIDPTVANKFSVTINIGSFINADNIVIKEFVPAEFEVETDANVEIINDVKVLTWNKVLIDSKTSVGYSYTVPNIWPILYALGPIEINYGSIFSEARPWYVAVDPKQFANEALIVYRQGSTWQPRYRIWDGAAWGGESNAGDIGDRLRWSVLKPGIVRNEMILGTMDRTSAGSIDVQVFDMNSGSWSSVTPLTSNAGSENTRGFDVAYETKSGDAIIVYADNTNTLKYRIWDGAAWSGELSITVSTTGVPRWVELASDPNSDEIILVTIDSNNHVQGIVWDGANDVWGNGQTFEVSSVGETMAKNFDVTYESSSGEALVAYTQSGQTIPRYRTWTDPGTGFTWSDEFIDAKNIGSVPEQIRLAADPQSDDIMLCTNDAASDLNCQLWDGTNNNFGSNSELNTALQVNNRRPWDIAWESLSTPSKLLAVYSTSISPNNIPRYQTFDETSGWSGENSAINIGAAGRYAILRSDPYSNDMFLVTLDSARDVNIQRWDSLGSTWTGLTQPETGSHASYESIDLAFEPKIVELTLTGDAVGLYGYPGINFGTDLALNAVYDTDDTTGDPSNGAMPFVLENTGNTILDIDFMKWYGYIPPPLLWESGVDSDLQYKIDPTTECAVVGCYTTADDTLFIDLTTTPKTAITELKAEDSNNEVEIEIRIHVPQEEPPGTKYVWLFITATESP